MKYRQILFSGEMVRAILEGRKTMTRRIIKGNPQFEFDRATEVNGGIVDSTGKAFQAPCKPGDRLYQFHCEWDDYSPSHIAAQHKCDDKPSILYTADRPDYMLWDSRKRPSIHMPRWASRITLEVVSVRVERLNDINSQGAEAEGCPLSYNPETGYHEIATGHGTPVYWFEELWESINGEGSWSANPWVWVIEFKQVKE